MEINYDPDIDKAERSVHINETYIDGIYCKACNGDLCECICNSFTDNINQVMSCTDHLNVNIKIDILLIRGSGVL